jgi:hypothetical protein
MKKVLLSTVMTLAFISCANAGTVVISNVNLNLSQNERENGWVLTSPSGRHAPITLPHAGNDRYVVYPKGYVFDGLKNHPLYPDGCQFTEIAMDTFGQHKISVWLDVHGTLKCKPENFKDLKQKK